MWRFGLLLLTALLAAGAARAGDRADVLIAPFPPSALSPSDAARLDGELRAATAALPGVEVQPRATTERALTAMEQLGLSCHPEETRCLVQLGALANVGRVISTAAVMDRGSFRVTLRLIDVAGKSELRHIEGVVPEAELRAGLEGLATGLLLPSLYKGRLRVEVEQARAMIIVDGELRGTTPLSAPLEIGAGRRTVRIEKDGFASVEQVVVIPFGGEAVLRATLIAGENASGTYVARTRVLVLDLLADGEGLPNPRTLASLIAVELARDRGIDVLSGTDVDQLVSAAEAGMEIDCKDTGCLTDLAGAFDVPFIVHGDIGLVGSVLIVHLDVFDAKRLETVARTSVENTDRDRLPNELKAAARQLLRDARAARPEMSSAKELPPVDEPTTKASDVNMMVVAGYTTAGAGAAVAFVGTVVAIIFGSTYLGYLGHLGDYEAPDSDAQVKATAVEAIREDVRIFYPAGPYALPAGIAAAALGVTAVGAGLAMALALGGEE